MGRKKKMKEFSEETLPPETPEAVLAPLASKKVIHPLAVDFSSEQLNDMARKINEVIDALNG